MIEPAVRFVRLAILVVFVGAAANCAKEEPPVQVEPVQTAVESRFAYDSLAPLSLQPVRSVCGERSAECVIDYGGVAASDAQGVVFTGQNKYKQLTLVDGDPPAVRFLGRTGAGPGEFQSINVVGFSPAGEVLGADIYQHRILKYARDGRVLATTTIAIPAGFLEAGFVQGGMRIIAIEAPKRKGDSVPISVYAVDSGVNSHHMLYSLPLLDKPRQMGDMIPVPRMFSPVKQWAFGSDGTILFTRGDSLLIEVFDSTGRHVRRFGFDVDTRKVTERDVERRRAARLRAVSDPALRNAMDGARSPMPRHPAITKLRWFQNGQVWVRQSEDESGERVRWIVFGKEFSPVGVVELPVETAIIAGRDSLILVARPTSVGSANELVWARVIPRVSRK